MSAEPNATETETETQPAVSGIEAVVPLLDRLASNVRGALWGLVTGLFLAVMTLSGYIWHGHIEAEREKAAELSKTNDAQDIELAKIRETIARFEKESEEYRTQQALQLTKRVEFEARALTVMERLDGDVKELRSPRRK